VNDLRFSILSAVKSSVRTILIHFFELIVVVLLPPVFLARVLNRKPIQVSKRSVWTGAPILTMPIKASAEKALGFDSVTLVRSSFFITSSFDFNLKAISRGSRVLAFLLPYVFFLWICATSNRVHAFLDGGILPPKQRFEFNPFELWCYRLFGIKLFVWTYGADVRTRQSTRLLGEPNCCSDCTQVGEACICDDAAGVENYSRVRTVATAIFSMGDMTEYTPGSVNNLFFWPLDFNADDGKRYRAVYPHAVSSVPLRVVHAPNHRQFKGTKYLEAAVKELQEEGVPIDLVMVEGMPNDQALELFRTADVIFDQCLIGFHGYFAIEAMALGKPVMCYIRDPERYLLDYQNCPIINIHRDHLKDALRRFATKDRGLLPDIGYSSRAYAERNFSLEAFACRLGECYEKLGVAF